MRIIELRNQLAELRKKETVAQTRQQLLDEEKTDLLMEVQELLNEIKKLNIVSEEELTSQNLSNVVEKIKCHIETEISKSQIPKELIN